MYHSENLTRKLTLLIIPIYGRLFDFDDYNVEEFDRVSKENATKEEREKYFDYSSFTIKRLGVFLMFFTICGGIISIFIGHITIGVFCSFLLSGVPLCIGISYDFILEKNKKTIQSYKKGHLFNAIFWAIFTSAFAALLFTVGESTK